MAANINPNTGVAYGVISARSLDPEIIAMIEDNGDNVSEQNAEDEIRREINAEIEGGKLEADAFGDEMEKRIQRWHENSDEHVYRYVEYDDDGKIEVEVYSTWLGGAQLLYVIQSPHLCSAAPCSPCCPNAGDLDNRYENGDRGVTCYDVPPDWRAGVGELEATVESDEESGEEESATQELADLEPYVCEVVLKGFDGGTDETDDKVLWVVTSMTCDELATWMTERGLAYEMVSATDVHTGDDAVDFDLPEEEHDFIATVKELSK